MKRALTRMAVVTSLCACAPLYAQSSGKIVIRVGRVITMAGADIQNGVIVIEDGKIKAVGSDVKSSWDANVIDQPNMVAFPGFVEAHSSRGMDRPNENFEVAPFLDVRDSIDPINFFFEDALRFGVTTINVQQGPLCLIGGQGRVVKPFGLTVEAMTVRPGAGLKISTTVRQGRSRATQAQGLRRAFDDLRRGLEKLVQDKKDGNDTARREALFQGRDLEKEENKQARAMEGSAPWKIKDFDIVPRGEVDEKLEPLLRLVEGKLMAFVQCDSAAGVDLALEIARDNGFLANTVLVVDGDAWKAADAIAEAGVPVVLGPSLVFVERDPVTGKESETFVPAVFHKKKIRFALQSQNQGSQSLWYQAATSIGLGLTRQQALESVTTTPAEMLRLSKRVGSLEVGKDGNVVLFNGDPLAVTSSVQYVVLDGNLVYDRSKDVRVKHLIEGIEQSNAAPITSIDDDVDPHSGKKKSTEKSAEKSGATTKGDAKKD